MCLKGLIFLLALLVALSVLTTTTTATAMDYVKSILDQFQVTTAGLGDQSRMNSQNHANIQGTDKVTLTSKDNRVTLEMNFRGWDAMMCAQGTNPDTSRCYVDESVDLTNDVLYTASVSNKAFAVTYANYRELGKKIVINETTGMTTLSLDFSILYKYVYYCDKDGCLYKTEIWSSSIAKTIPAPIQDSYSNSTLNVNRAPWGENLTSDVFNNNLGFKVSGTAPVYSFKNITEEINGTNSTPENKSISLEFSRVSNVYDIRFNERRGIYYGELRNLESPQVNGFWGNVLYNNSKPWNVSCLIFPPGFKTTEVFVLTPHGMKTVEWNENITKVAEETNWNEYVSVLSAYATTGLLFYAIVRLIRR